MSRFNLEVYDKADRSSLYTQLATAVVNDKDLRLSSSGRDRVGVGAEYKVRNAYFGLSNARKSAFFYGGYA
jgi:hypothetical protein